MTASPALPPPTPLHRCAHCSATSYRPVLARDLRGALRPTGRYRCSGCEVVFSHAREWRDGTAPREVDEFACTVPMSLQGLGA